MFCNSWCNNNSTNFNNNSCGCNSCGCNNNNRSGRNSSGCGCGNNNGCGCSNNCGCNNNNGCGCSNNNGCGCNRCRQRTNGGCGWYSCPCSCSCGNDFFWTSSTVTNQVPPTTPTINLGYFTAATATAVASDGVIPVALTRQIGQQITSSGSGALLPVGVYEVSYSLTGRPTATPTATPETVSVGIKLNGVTLPLFTQSASTTSTTDPYNISAHGLIAVTTPNSILTLNNLGAETQTYSDINLVVRKI